MAACVSVSVPWHWCGSWSPMNTQVLIGFVRCLWGSGLGVKHTTPLTMPGTLHATSPHPTGDVVSRCPLIFGVWIVLCVLQGSGSKYKSVSCCSWDSDMSGLGGGAAPRTQPCCPAVSSGDVGRLLPRWGTSSWVPGPHCPFCCGPSTGHSWQGNKAGLFCPLPRPLGSWPSRPLPGRGQQQSGGAEKRTGSMWARGLVHTTQGEQADRKAGGGVGH